MKQPKITLSPIDYSDYRTYLKDVIKSYIEQGGSLRGLSATCGFKNPNFLRLVETEQREMTVDAAEKLAAGLKLKASDAKYLVSLVKLGHSRYKNKEAILGDLRSLAKNTKYKDVFDGSIHGSWLHGLIFELANTKDFRFTMANLTAKIGSIATRASIEDSLDFLKKKGWLVPTDDPEVWKQGEVHFPPLDDVRRIDLQRSHLHYLDLAKHRINDPIDQRLYRGLTIAIPIEKLPDIKDAVKEFFSKIEAHLDGAKDADTVIRIQTCVFKLTNK